jgi:PAS domain S-box-containing protein
MPGLPVIPPQPFAPLLGVLPVAVAGAWLGPGPALLVGLVNGILRAGTTTGSIADPFRLALFGSLIGFLLRQNYRGRLPLVARQPVVAMPLMMSFSALLLLISSFAQAAGSGLAGLDYAVTLTSAYLPPGLLEALIAALALHGIYRLLPLPRPLQSTRRPPPYAKTLNRRLLFLFVPLIGLITVVLVYAVTATALRLATSEAVDQMARDAYSAAEGIPDFIQTGQGLLAEFAEDERLWHADEEALEARLRRDMRTIVFFDQFLLLESSGEQLLAAYPPSAMDDPQLTAEERTLLRRSLESGMAQVSSVHRSEQGLVILSFLAPMTNPDRTEESEGPSRVLLGRTQPAINPILNRILTGLQWTSARGEGFVVDSARRIVAHPDSNMLLAQHRIEEEPSRVAEAPGGWAYGSRNPRDNTRQLVYHLPIDGYPWAVVIQMPYEVILEKAGRIAAPLLALQILLGGGLAVVISLVTNWVTQPLQQLAVAADRIAEGDLSHPVEIAGQDEVARVGDAFEDMRVRLRDRMEDLSLLLEVSQSVSATLDLPKGVQFILEGALRATEAQVARIVLISADGEPQVALSRGEPREGLEPLDRALAQAAKHLDGPLIVEDLTQATTLLDPAPLNGVIESVVALPIRTRRRVPAVMWVGFGAARRFDESDVDLLSTLASQTAVLVDNARLFQTADGERRRLAAILASTADAVLVADRDNRILLVNPALEAALGVTSERISGQRIDKTSLPQVLVDVFREPLDPDESLTRELSLTDGRTLYANVSAILTADSERLGRVAVIRDITHLKELDELKSDFVATVSHDLRTPLTVMRGYAAMLLEVGKLNQRQREYVERILQGIGYISELVDDLLNLGRIEAGVGLEREPCHLGAILTEALDTMRAQAAAKGITLRRESVTPSGSPPDGAAIVSGDALLLIQAITNVLDNAIKYTPGGGTVVAGLSTQIEGRRKRAVIQISDTGIGIAPADQVRLFEKFYRVKHRDAPGVAGTGLGLAIVKSIVERHGGDVWVESELNQGSTFYISLPLSERLSID